MKKTNSLRRLHFQILEVMVAVFLILLCAVPSLEIFTNMYKRQAEANISNQKDHLLRLAHASIVEQLYKNEIPINDVIEGRENELNDSTLKNELNKIGYEASYKFSLFSHKTLVGAQEATYLLADLIIKMKKKGFNEKTGETKPEEIDYKYVVYIQRGKNNPGGSEGDPGNPDGSPRPVEGMQGGSGSGKVGELSTPVPHPGLKNQTQGNLNEADAVSQNPDHSDTSFSDDDEESSELSDSDSDVSSSDEDEDDD